VSGLIILLLALGFMVLFYLVFRSPTPGIGRLGLFLVWLAVGGLLAYFFAVRVLDYDPDPARLAIARMVTNQKIIDLTQIVPGLPEDLDMIYRIDTDGDDERIEDEEAALEWLVVYRYDTVQREGVVVGGPFGAAIYDTGLCRPPSIFSFELVPVSYDYLGQDGLGVEVVNAIEYEDPLADPKRLGVDRPEVIITGYTGGTATDLNIFRKVGYYTLCRPTRAHADPYAETIELPFKYQVIGTFRGTYRVERNGATVVVKDRAGFERSQIVVSRVYTPDPNTGSYLRQVGSDPDRYELRAPDEEGLAFGPGRPEQTQQVYYPEKAVLSFFLDLGTNTERAMGLTCQGKGRNDYEPANFGLSLPLSDLARVKVCEMRYVPDDQAERAHEARRVGVKVVEVPKEIPPGETMDCSRARPLTCTVLSQNNPNALPFGCEWCLYNCEPAP
jgi:hypothetical protein